MIFRVLKHGCKHGRLGEEGIFAHTMIIYRFHIASGRQPSTVGQIVWCSDGRLTDDALARGFRVHGGMVHGGDHGTLRVIVRDVASDIDQSTSSRKERKERKEQRKGGSACVALSCLPSCLEHFHVHFLVKIRSIHDTTGGTESRGGFSEHATAKAGVFPFLANSIR